MAFKVFKPGQNIKRPSICVYGPGGAGKTTLVGTMPGPGLLIDIPSLEGGEFVLADKADRIDVVRVEDKFEEIDDIYWAIAKKDTKLLPNVESYRWIAIDTITAMQELAKRKVIGERDIPKADHKVSPQDWGYTGQLTGELLYRFNKLPYTNIWLAQQRKFGGGDEEDSEPTQIGPAILPSVLTPLFQPLMMVGRLWVVSDMDGKEHRLLRVGQHHLYLTKVRAMPGKHLPRVIARPNLGGILSYLFADGKRPRAYREDETGVIVD